MRKARAILFPRGLVGTYGFGYLAVDQDGITVSWSGWLVKRRPVKFTWSQIDAVTIRGSWIRVVISGRLGTLSAFVFHPEPAINDLRRLAPSKISLVN